MKIVTIVGARPQFIKAAPVSHAFDSRADVEEILAHTGQHFDKNMSDVFFSELSIRPPKYNLEIGGGTHGQNTGRMIEAIETVLVSEKPDWVLVYGDTDSTLAGAIAAAKLHVPIAHVEAGLRSYNRSMPEEMNRKVADHLAALLLTPNDGALRTLEGEGIRGEMVRNVGDVMFDAALHFGAKAEEQSTILDVLGCARRGYVLATVHRQENTDDPVRLERILKAFRHFECPVVLPLHPRTRKRIDTYALELSPNILVTDPVGYLDMLMLKKNASLIATDSGGVQKEAYFHGVPCVTLRDETEWCELIELGWNVLASPDAPDFLDKLLQQRGPGRLDASPYGSGQAAVSVVKAIMSSRLD